jgi:hypothetical protein
MARAAMAGTTRGRSARRASRWIWGCGVGTGRPAHFGVPRCGAKNAKGVL